jgi:hypothetical protein
MGNCYVLQSNTFIFVTTPLKMQSKKDSTIILRVEEDLKKALQELADLDSRKLADFIRLQLKKLVESKKQK